MAASPEKNPLEETDVMLRRQHRQKLHVRELKYPAIQAAEQAATHLSMDCSWKVVGDPVEWEWHQEKHFLPPISRSWVGLSSDPGSATTTLTSTQWTSFAHQQRWEHTAGPAVLPEAPKFRMFPEQMHLQHLEKRTQQSDGPLSETRRAELSWWHLRSDNLLLQAA